MASRTATVLLNERVTGGAHRVLAQVEGDWPATAPGQFTMLSTQHPRFPLLPRPFSLLGARRDGDTVQLEWLIMPIGIGSGLLCSLQAGEQLSVVGPLGHGLAELLPPGPVICVAGGYGIAPFIFLLEDWARRGDARAASTRLIFGARSAERLCLAERVTTATTAADFCTDDGSRGFAGRVDRRLTECLAEERAAGRPVAAVLTCGPEAMMEAVGACAAAAGVACHASLETQMGCGFAVCNGCAVAVSSGAQPDGYTYELACREGTVFDSTRLVWHPPV